MVIKICLSCDFHELKQEGNESLSFCRKESCWVKFTKCIAKRALEKFLEEEKTEGRGETCRV